MHIQPPRTKLPSPLMTIRTLKIRTRTLSLRRNIPAPTTFISNKWSWSVRLRDTVHEFRVNLNAVQTVVDCECRAFERGHELGHGGLFILREDEIREVRIWHDGGVE